MEDSKAQALEEAAESSYRKRGLRASVNKTLSKASIKNPIHGLLVDMPKPCERKKEGKGITHQCGGGLCSSSVLEIKKVT